MIPPYDLCSIRVSSCCLLEWAVLEYRGHSSRREGRCTGQTLFAALPPGCFLLTVRRAERTKRLMLRLPPGANVEILWDAQDRLCWRRSLCHCFYNVRPRLFPYKI